MTAAIPRARLGLIIPSTNLTIERLLERSGFSELFGVDIVVTRLKVTTIASTPGSTRHFHPRHLLAAARLLVDARPDVIVWTGTSGFWLGMADEIEWMRATGAALSIPVTSATEAVVEVLKAREAIGAVSLLTPYEPSIHESVIETLREADFRVRNHRHLGITDNATFATIEAGRIEDEVRRFPEDEPVVVVCTGIVACFSGRDVIDSLIAVLWFAMTLVRRNGSGEHLPPDYQSVYDSLAVRLA